MSKTGQNILKLLLWTFGGTAYFLLEVIYKSATNEPEKISWTMLLVAIILTIPVERCGYQLPWECPLVVQAFVCATVVTLVEFVTGVVLNILLHLNIWDYSHLWGNILGQVCPQFFLVWFVLCLVFIVIFDYMWYFIYGGQKPTYTLL